MARPRKTENQLTKDDLLKNKDGVIKNLQEMCSDLVNDNLDLLEACEKLKAELVSIEKDHKSDTIFKVIMAVLITL